MLPPVCCDIADARALPLDTETVDAIITSPPYALDVPYELGDVAPAEWEAFTAAWLSEAWRVGRSGCRLAVNVPLDTTKGYRPAYAQLVGAATAAGWQYRTTVVWSKYITSVARGSLRNPHVVTPCETVAILFKGAWLRPAAATDLEHSEWLSWTDGLWSIPGIRQARAFGKYPATFPEELPRRLVKLLSVPGETVLDPFCGSGTTPAVARRLGRRALAFDVSPLAVSLTRARLEIAADEKHSNPPAGPVRLAPGHSTQSESRG